MVLQETPLSERHVSAPEKKKEKKKKMLTQQYIELGSELQISDGSYITGNGKGHGKLLKLKQVTYLWHKRTVRK